MRVLLASAFLIGLTGCPTTDKDTGDTSGGDDTNTNMTPFMLLEDAEGMVTGTGVTGVCASDVCTYTMTTSTEASASDFSLDMTETGDDSGGQQWNENHTAFALDSENADGSFTYKLVLDAVTSFEDVVSNSTTLFYEDAVLLGTTWFFSATSLDSSTTDCVVNGEDASYYASQCSNAE